MSKRRARETPVAEAVRVLEEAMSSGLKKKLRIMVLLAMDEEDQLSPICLRMDDDSSEMDQALTLVMQRHLAEGVTRFNEFTRAALETARAKVGGERDHPVS